MVVPRRNQALPAASAALGGAARVPVPDAGIRLCALPMRRLLALIRPGHFRGRVPGPENPAGGSQLECPVQAGNRWMAVLTPPRLPRVKRR